MGLDTVQLYIPESFAVTPLKGRTGTWLPRLLEINKSEKIIIYIVIEIKGKISDMLTIYECQSLE